MSKKFRIQSKSFFLTYKSHIEFTFIKSLEQMCQSIDKDITIKNYIICHENGDEKDNYLHTHITFLLTKTLDLNNERLFDYTNITTKEIIHPNIQSSRSLAKSVNYCKKDGIYESNFKDNNKEICTKVDLILEQKSCIDAIKATAENLRDVIAIKTIYDLKEDHVDQDYIDEMKNITLNEWQTYIDNIIKANPNRRNVFWIYDYKGGAGKSMYCDYLENNDPTNTFLYTATGSQRDLADVLRNWMYLGNKPNTIIMDLPRNCQDKESIYGFIENMKNGRLTCTKYKGAKLVFRPANVYVFANWPPVIKHFSEDRWKIYQVKDGIATPCEIMYGALIE